MDEYLLQQQVIDRERGQDESAFANRVSELEAPLTHLWARTTHGHTCLVRALPQSYMWV